jgi:Na+/H+-translocating membrane pyrophosphatase
MRAARAWLAWPALSTLVVMAAYEASLRALAERTEGAGLLAAEDAESLALGTALVVLRLLSAVVMPAALLAGVGFAGLAIVERRSARKQPRDARIGHGVRERARGHIRFQ